MEAAKLNITGIFNRANKLKVPYFQRAYVWEEEHWERFLDDMRYAARTSHLYFMGSVILKQQETAVNQDNVRTIIDGQQRLTTIILFFKALFNKNETPERFTETFTTFKRGIILEHNYLDKPTFDKICLGQDLDAREGSSQIGKCFSYFLKNIEKDAIDPNNLLANVIFVSIYIAWKR